MKAIPFERVRAERVSSFSSTSQKSVTKSGKQRAGTAKHSLIGRLLDDYDAAGVVDHDHEYDLKLVGAAMYAGEKHLVIIRLRVLTELSPSWSRDGAFTAVTITGSIPNVKAFSLCVDRHNYGNFHPNDGQAPGSREAGTRRD